MYQNEKYDWKFHRSMLQKRYSILMVNHYIRVFSYIAKKAAA